MTAYSMILFFFFNDTATTEIYTLSLHDALPISLGQRNAGLSGERACPRPAGDGVHHQDAVRAVHRRLDLVEGDAPVAGVLDGGGRRQLGVPADRLHRPPHRRALAFRG